LRGLLDEGGFKRREAAEQAVKSVGGTLEAFYFSFGDKDFYVIVDMPDNVSTTAASLVETSAEHSISRSLFYLHLKRLTRR
jgi:uncharacterized protein with GYD domain